MVGLRLQLRLSVLTHQLVPWHLDRQGRKVSGGWWAPGASAWPRGPVTAGSLGCRLFLAWDIGLSQPGPLRGRDCSVQVAGQEAGTAGKPSPMVVEVLGRPFWGGRLSANASGASDGVCWCCAGCSTDFGPISANYKLGCARVDAPIATANPNVGDWKRYIDQKPIFRQFFCPGCGDLIENEIARWDDPLLSDVEVKL